MILSIVSNVDYMKNFGNFERDIAPELTNDIRDAEDYTEMLSGSIGYLEEFIADAETRDLDGVREMYFQFSSLTPEMAQEYKERGHTDIPDLQDKESMLDALREDLRELKEDRDIAAIATN